MSRARHKEKHRAEGGGVKPVWNAGGEQNAAKEAEEKRHGGKVKAHGEGEESKHRADRRARGGRVARAHGGKAEAGKVHFEHHGGAPVVKHHRAKGGRVRGEGVGADMTPLTTAAKVKHVTEGEQDEHGMRSD